MTKKGRNDEKKKNLAILFIFFAGCAYFNTFYNAQVLFREGIKLKEQGQAGTAKMKFEKVIEKSALVISRWPKSQWVDDALFLIGRSYYEKGDFKRAATAFEQLTLIYPKSKFVPQATLYQALALFKDGQVGSARLILEELKARYPRLREAAEYYLALLAIERDEDERGINALLSFIQQYPRSPYVKSAIRYLIDGYSQKGDYEKAEFWAKRYCSIEPDPRRRAELQLKIAQLLLRQNKFAEAVAVAQAVFGKYSEIDEELNLVLGKAYIEMGKPTEALAAFQQVRSASARGAEAAFLIGKFYEKSKDFVRAKAYYDTARNRRVECEYGIYAIKRLGLLEALIGDTLKKRTPAESLFLFAEIHNLNLGEYDTALVLYQRVYDSFPQTEWAPKALFAQAWIYHWIKKESLNSAEIMKKIIAEYPNSVYATESKKRLGIK